MTDTGSFSDRLVNLVNRYIWCVWGLVVVAFGLLSLESEGMLALVGQACLVISLFCMAFAQIERLDTTTCRYEHSLGTIAVILSLAGLVLIWPSEAGYIVTRLAEGLHAVCG